MGLFSHKYGEKDYIKNAQLFGSQIEELSELINEDVDFKRKLNAIDVEKANDSIALSELAGLIPEEAEGTSNKKLMKIVDTLNDSQRTFKKKADMQQLEKLDARIERLLDSMRDDIQEGKALRYCEHVEMLRQAVRTARKYCRDNFTPEELDCQEKMAICRGQIDEFELKRNSNRLKMEMYAKKVADVNENSKEFRDTERLFQAAADENKKIDAQLNRLNANYTNLMKAHALRLNEITIATINETQINPIELEKKVQKMMQEIELQDEKMNDVSETLGEIDKLDESSANQSTTSDLKKYRDEMKRDEMSDKLGNADYSGAPSSGESDLKAFLRNNK